MKYASSLANKNGIDLFNSRETFPLKAICEHLFRLLPFERGAFSYAAVQETLDTEQVNELANQCHAIWQGQQPAAEMLLSVFANDVRQATKHVFCSMQAQLDKQQQVVGLDILLQTEQVLTAFQGQQSLLTEDSKFLSILSHELRTPLHGLKGMLDLIRDEHINDEMQPTLASAKSSVNHLRRLLDGILDSTRIKKGKIHLTPTNCNIIELTRLSIDELQVQARIKGLQINLYQSQHMISNIYSDQVRIKQIISNILSNAIKYTTKGYIDVSLSSIMDDDLHHKVEIVITDTGVGIDQVSLQSIYQAFYQSRRDDANVGLGIGLYLTKELVELLGGTLDLTSTLGEGTTVRIILPIRYDFLRYGLPETARDKKGNKLVVDNQSEDNPALSLSEYDSSKLLLDKSVIIAEDDPINMVILTDIMQRLGSEMTCVYNGEELLEACQNNKYDFILTDINMPVLNGDKAAQQIRQFDLQTPIIAFTAQVFEDDLTGYLSSGIDKVLPKPFDIDQVKTCFQQLMQEER